MKCRIVANCCLFLSMKYMAPFSLKPKSSSLIPDNCPHVFTHVSSYRRKSVTTGNSKTDSLFTSKREDAEYCSLFVCLFFHGITRVPQGSSTGLSLTSCFCFFFCCGEGRLWHNGLACSFHSLTLSLMAINKKARVFQGSVKV